MRVLSFAICLTFVLTIASFSGISTASASTPTYRQSDEQLQILQIYVTAKDTISKLASMGVDVAEVKADSIIALVTNWEIKKLDEMGIKYQVLNKNANSLMKKLNTYGKYHSVAEVEQFLKATEKKYPNLCKLEIIGYSIEKRPIYAIKISSNVSKSANKPSSLFMGLHHAREWISAEVPVALISELTQKYATNSKIRDLVDSCAIWVVPIVNPDGLNYSQTASEMWRKNRRGGYGVDLNRNYSYKWSTVGASDYKWAETYHGTNPFSEPCSCAIRDLAKRENFTTSISFHSYGELILYPFGYAENISTPDDPLFMRLAGDMAKINGYTPERSADLYPASGDSDDYLYGELKTLSFTIELGSQFIPEASEVNTICAKNVNVCLYLIDKSKTVHARDHVKKNVPVYAGELAVSGL